MKRLFFSCSITVCFAGLVHDIKKNVEPFASVEDYARFARNDLRQRKREARHTTTFYSSQSEMNVVINYRFHDEDCDC
jgi:hypothetical protein